MTLGPVIGIGGTGAAGAAGTKAVQAACANGDCTNEVRAADRAIGSGWTVLGKYPAYVEEGKRLGANILNMAKEEWDALGSQAARWVRNVEFLDEAIARGDTFRLATPFAEGWAARGFTYFKAELAYLLQKGYELITVNGVDYLVPPVAQ